MIRGSGVRLKNVGPNGVYLPDFATTLPALPRSGSTGIASKQLVSFTLVNFNNSSNACRESYRTS